jgi:alpha-L-rhamnosidase
MALASLAPAIHAEDLLNKVWGARWISVPNTAPFDYGVYHFRRTFDLPGKPLSFVVHVTADNRYQLYVNGVRAAWGPARGDLLHWRYETVDIATHLRAGRNVVAAVVWNHGAFAAHAQMTFQAGFLLQGDGPPEALLNTSSRWKCIRNAAYAPLPLDEEQVPFFYAAGPGERLDGALYPWGWEKPEFDDSLWQPAHLVSPAAPRNVWARTRWVLVPRSIPAMEETPQRIPQLRKAEGIPAPPGFPAVPQPFLVPANTTARLLVDQTHLTTAYPELVVSAGKGAMVTLRYAESLWASRSEKGNRNDTEGKRLYGTQDVFVTDGGVDRLYRPLWWRTYRYLELIVETKSEPLLIEDLHGVYTGYPFEKRARFDAGSAELERILEVGWRTARLCAHETYMDCPYYEQLQYAGDTRIQALVSLYMSGDDRLMRNAIEQLNSSRTSDGLTFSRYPSRQQQFIPPFSLWWIGMVHDYWMYRGDPAFVRQNLPGVRAVLSFFAERHRPDGSLGPLPWWNFLDWTKQWQDGVPPTGADGSSAPAGLQLLLACQWAAGMEAALGSTSCAAEDARQARRLENTIRQAFWDPARRLFADTSARKDFSQQTNALAVLAGIVQGKEARELIERVAADHSLVQCSIYFRHYLHAAMNLAGSGDLYLDQLGEWRSMLSRGLTTWAEQADPTRSDCHAWGSSPNFELFRTVLGIDSAAPGFRRVSIRPFLGPLARVSGAIPHPKGEIAVSLLVQHGNLKAEVTLPAGVDGEFDWHGKRRSLPPGRSSLVFPQ